MTPFKCLDVILLQVYNYKKFILFKTAGNYEKYLLAYMFDFEI